jgi:hypothetical protein
MEHEAARKAYFAEAAAIVQLCESAGAPQLAAELLKTGSTIEAATDRLAGRLKLVGRWPPPPFKEATR